MKDFVALAQIADTRDVVPVNAQRLASFSPGRPPGLCQPVRLPAIADRIGIPPALYLHDRIENAVASHRGGNQDHP